MGEAESQKKNRYMHYEGKYISGREKTRKKIHM